MSVSEDLRNGKSYDIRDELIYAGKSITLTQTTETKSLLLSVNYSTGIYKKEVS